MKEEPSPLARRLPRPRRAAALAAVLLLGASAAAADVSGHDGLAPSSGAGNAASPRERPVPTAARDVEKLLGELRRDSRETTERFDALGKRADAAGVRALLRGRAYARLARLGLLAAGGGFQGLIEHATRIERLRRGIEIDVTEQKRAIVERAKLARRLDELKARIEPLAQEYEALARVESALLSAEDRERAFRRAFDGGSADNRAAVYGALGPADPAEVAAGFAGMRGRLPFPIAGRAEINRARRGSDSPGLEMHAPLGTVVRAVYPGRVAFADTYGEYGRAVIIDHGGRYYTVTASLGGIDVKVGDQVELNTRIGTVGDAGKGALVYVEVRFGTDTVNPGDWFGI
jgi:murein DD-endopeptidase MepM/ murein hydrolase activator NlpD